MSLTPSCLSYLRQAAETASWDAGRQISWVERTGFAVDEIALQVDDFHLYAVNRPETFPEGVRRNLSALVEVFDTMAEDGWAPAAVHASTCWAAVRAPAAAIVEEMGDGLWLLPDDAWD
ncbi:hypothetical protein SUDANB121_05716 [Nocardiopsis dassonvillei]|uniref:hypothetical protein n=1 Tax=Nocardiopsis dassonvillei TaxID=2014 RepID=UPI003F54365B